MAQFPRYESKGQLTTQQPSVQAPEETEGKIQEINANLGQAVQDTTVKWANAIDTIQKTTAQANFKTGILDIQTRAANDPNYNNSDQYFKEIEKLKTDNLRGFASKTAETEMAIALDYEEKVAQIQIDNLYKKKMIDVGQAGALKTLDMLAQDPTTSEATIKENLNLWKQNQLFDEKDAYKLEENYITKLKFNTFLSDFRSDPQAAEKKVLQNSYGMDAETAEKARSKLKELKAIQREQEGIIYNDMSLRVTTGEITDDEINSAMALNKQNPNEGITEAHGKQLLAARYRDITKRIGAKEFEKHKKAIDFVFSSSSQDRIKGYEAILEAYTDGLSKEDAKFLDQILKTKKDITFANKAAAGKEFISTLFGARPKNVEFETQSLLSYAKRIADGASPEVAAQKTAVDIIQKDHPATIADPELVGAFTPKKGFKNIPKVKIESSS